MTLFTPSLITPSTSKLLSYFPFSNHSKSCASSKQNDPNIPTYITIIMRKDGTPTTKCLNPRSTVLSTRRRRSQSYGVTSPPKLRKISMSSFIPRFHHNKRSQDPREEPITADYLTLRNRLQQLPTEIITQILLYLDLVSVQRVSQTCRQFNRICGHKNHYLWQTLFHADFLIPKKRPDSTPYYELYKSHFELDKRWKNGQVTTRYLTGHDDSVYCLVWAGKDKIVSGSRDWSIKLWDLSKPKSESPLVLTKTQHEGSVLCLRVSPDMSFIVSGSSDATCLIWSLPDFTPKKRLEGHTGGVLDVCVLDNYIVSSSRDTTIRVWDMSGREVRRLVGHSGPVNALGSHEDRVVSASGDATIKLWNIVTGDCLRTFTGHTRGLACVKFDGALIYSGGQDNKLKVWDSKTGECVSTLSGHSDLIRTIDSFEDRAVSGSYDKTLRVWDSKKKRCLLSFQSGHSSWIFNCLLNRTKIVSAGQDKRIMVLDFGSNLTTIDR